MKSIVDRRSRVGSWLAAAAIAAVLGTPSVVWGQTALRRGVLPLPQIIDLAERSALTLSGGTLAELSADPNFAGNLQAIVNTAAGILDGYTIVQRGGYFPENAGIPREQQLTRSEAVYSIFALENGNELVLFRTPAENTSRYFIRRTR